KLGWLWDSILTTTAWPSPISTTPAFSPGPWMTRGPVVGKVRSHFLDDLYEQCSFHIAEKMPSSVKLGSRPISARMRSYSSGLRPCAAISSGVMGIAFGMVISRFRIRSGKKAIGCNGYGRDDGKQRQHHQRSLRDLRHALCCQVQERIRIDRQD